MHLGSRVKKCSMGLTIVSIDLNHAGCFYRAEHRKQRKQKSLLREAWKITKYYQIIVTYILHTLCMPREFTASGPVMAHSCHVAAGVTIKSVSGCLQVNARLFTCLGKSHSLSVQSFFFSPSREQLHKVIYCTCHFNTPLTCNCPIRAQQT